MSKYRLYIFWRHPHCGYADILRPAINVLRPLACEISRWES